MRTELLIESGIIFSVSRNIRFHIDYNFISSRISLLTQRVIGQSRSPLELIDALSDYNAFDEIDNARFQSA
jgi:hypothetical protein